MQLPTEEHMPTEKKLPPIITNLPSHCRKDNSTTETYIQSGVCKVYYLQNISENEEDLLSYPKFVIKKETFTANHGSFTQDFHKEFSEHEVFHKVQRSSV